MCSRSSSCSLIASLRTWTCHSHVDCLKERQRPCCHRGTTMLLAFIYASIPWGTPSLPVSERCCWYLQQKLTCRLCRSSKELSLTIQKASELSLCEFHFKLFGALTVVPTLSTRLGYPPLWRCRQCQCSNAALTRGLQVGHKGSCKYTDVLSLLQTRVTQKGHMC